MRELVEGKFDGGPDTRCNTRSIDLTRCRPQQNVSPVPLPRARIERPRPAAGGTANGGRFYVLLAAFYKWCKKAGVKINVDYPLSDPWHNWPIWTQLNRILKKRSGFETEDFFWQVQWELDHDEQAEWDYCYMPLWSLANGGDEEVIVEFLHNIWNCDERIGLPEEVWHIDGLNKEAALIAEAVFQNLVEQKRHRLMPANWRNALDTLSEYDCSSICVWDPEEGKIEMEPTARSMEMIFVCAAKVGKMLDGTEPIVEEYCREELEFWNHFIEHLTGVARRHPELLKKVKS